MDALAILTRGLVSGEAGIPPPAIEEVLAVVAAPLAVVVEVQEPGDLVVTASPLTVKAEKADSTVTVSTRPLKVSVEVGEPV